MMKVTSNRRRRRTGEVMDEAEERDTSRIGQSRRKSSRLSRGSLLSWFTLLVLAIGLELAAAKEEQQSNFELSEIAEYCLGPNNDHAECFRLMPVRFQGDDDDSENELSVKVDSSVDLGRVCLEVIETNDGDKELEVSYELGDGWTMTEGHFWLGTSVSAAPLMLHYTHDGDNNGKGVGHKLPDATRFRFHTDMENLPDPSLQTTTYWNEVVQATNEVVCHPSGDETPEETGMRVFAAQAVVWNQEDDIHVKTFAALHPENSFAALEDYFILCACPGTTVETADGGGGAPSGEDLMEQIEEEHKGEKFSLNNLMHAEDELAETLQKEEKEEEKHEEEGEEQEEKEEQEQEQEEQVQEKSNENTTPPSPDSKDFDEIQEGHMDHHSSDEDEENHEDGPVVMVKADELEVTTSFIVIMPDQKHYVDMLLDEDALHKTEEQIEASPELHQAWHTFVEQLMSDFNIPSVNASEATNHARRRDLGGRRSLKAVNVEWIEDSPDLFRFLITTPCPANVLSDRRIDMGSSPKDLRTDGSSSKATCYKAFGKYKVLQLETADGDTGGSGSEDEPSSDYTLDEGKSRQEVCYEIFHMTRQELAKHTFEQDLPEDLPFSIYGGKPESCLPTGYSTTVPRPDEVPSLDEEMLHLMEDHRHPHRKKQALYELHKDDGSWDILRVAEFVAYLTTSMVMMGLCVLVYCWFLPKIDAESRNRVTDDWSQPSLRPQPIVSQRPKSEADYFPWLE
ncbi:expressed unknown protein [Seminavis robusta]|uniref:Uncharacterized protein n=1 Tax=Seminavis robusta TaxID=568900 RepID=A0A9N8DKF5_9STRA|nr:expressed unknown protein [Seminavis robusta]|eukprot:Sro129_g061660.1 n/a (738) ;mRNA; f:84972-87185